MSVKTMEGESASNDEVCNIAKVPAMPISDVSSSKRRVNLDQYFYLLIF